MNPKSRSPCAKPTCVFFAATGLQFIKLGVESMIRVDDFFGGPNDVRGASQAGNKALLKDYQAPLSLEQALLGPYFKEGGGIRKISAP